MANMFKLAMVSNKGATWILFMFRTCVILDVEIRQGQSCVVHYFLHFSYSYFSYHRNSLTVYIFKLVKKFKLIYVGLLKTCLSIFSLEKVKNIPFSVWVPHQLRCTVVESQCLKSSSLRAFLSPTSFDDAC